jgi:glycosyltransferase involved in cell wall biosynthesis
MSRVTDTKPKLLIDGRSLLDPHSGGVFEYTKEITTELKRRQNFDCQIWANQWRKTTQNSILGNDTVLTHWPNKLLHGSILLTGRPRLDELATKAGAGQPADVFWMPNLNFAAFSPQTKLALTIHDLSFERYPEFFTWKRRAWHPLVGARALCHRANVILAVSEHTKRDLVELYNIAPEKIQVTYHGVAECYRSPIKPEQLTETRRRLNLPERFILHVGTFEPRKNHLALLEAFALIKKNPGQKDLGLVLAGPKGWKNGAVERALRTHPNRADISHLGYVSAEDKASLYRLAAVFAFPSFYEGFGLPPLEAMSSGTPVVASFASSLGEVIGGAGILIDPYRPAELADALRAVLESPALAAELSKHGQAKALDFTWEKCAESTEKALNSI